MNLIRCKNCGKTFYLKGDQVPKGWTCGSKGITDIKGCGNKEGEVFIGIHVFNKHLKLALDLLRRNKIKLEA